MVQLTEAGVDSWERIYERFPVVNLNNGVEWDALDEQSVAALSLCCPLLGEFWCTFEHCMEPSSTTILQ